MSEGTLSDVVVHYWFKSDLWFGYMIDDAQVFKPQKKVSFHIRCTPTHSPVKIFFTDSNHYAFCARHPDTARSHLRSRSQTL